MALVLDMREGEATQPTRLVGEIRNRLMFHGAYEEILITPGQARLLQEWWESLGISPQNDESASMTYLDGKRLRWR